MILKLTNAARSPIAAWAAGSLVVVAVLLRFLWIVGDERDQATALWRDRLLAMAHDREAAIEGWIEEIGNQARSVAAFPSVAVLLSQAADPGGQSDEHLAAVLDQVRKAASLLGVAVLDEALRPLAQAGMPFSDEVRQEGLNSTLPDPAGTRVFLAASAGDGPVLAFLVPVPSTSPVARPGNVALLVDPSRWLYPLLRREPTPTRTGETLLVRRDGDSIVYLGPLRHRGGPPGTVRLASQASNLAERAALSPGDKLGEYRDYRGVPVLAAARQIAGSRWGLVVKVDQAEVFERVGTEVFQRGASFVAVLLGVIGLGFGLWHGQRAKHAHEIVAHEVALRESKSRSDEMLAQAERIAEVGSWRYDLIADQAIWSENMYRVLGVSRDDPEPLRMRGFVDRFVHPEDRGRVVAAVEAAVAGGPPYDTVYRVVHPDGSKRVIHGRAEVRRAADGRPVEMTGTVQDVTSRTRAEAALRDSEERYRTLFDENPMPMWAYDTETLRIVTANQAAAEQYGYTKSELTSMTLSDLRTAEEAARLQEAIKTKTSGRKHAGIWKHRRRDGTILDVDVHLNDVELDGQSLRLSVLHDVTQQRRLEEQLGQAQRMEAVGRLAGGVAHDFNNLLTVINGYGELLRATLPSGGTEREAIDEIVAAGNRAAALTRQLLAFSRKQVLEPKVLDLNGIVTNVDKMLRRLIGEDIDLVTAPAPDLWKVRADPGQVEQILMNLAVNARDAMPKGGKLTIETRNAELDEAYARRHLDVRPGPYVMLAVSDSGTGMDEATVARIFEPFFTTKEQGKGTGLGLSTVYGIVEQSGGNIWVYSVPGQGTTFKVYFPRSEDHVEPVRKSTHSGQFVALGHETVLLVEDDPAVRRLAHDVLVRQRYTVLVATDTDEALRLAQRHPSPIHLILTDVVMPGLSGPEIVARLRELRPDVKVLFMSGYSDEAVTHHGVLEADAAFLAKPFTAASLVGKVREVLGS